MGAGGCGGGWIRNRARRERGGLLTGWGGLADECRCAAACADDAQVGLSDADAGKLLHLFEDAVEHGRDARQSAKPVSYTHLTLPTKA